MSAALIFDIAPLGSLVAYSDGTPRPPARFTRKLAAWERRNGTARSWNVMADGRCLASLEDRASLVGGEPAELGP